VAKPNNPSISSARWSRSLPTTTPTRSRPRRENHSREPDAQADLQQGLDDIFNHPNIGPFIGKQLIQFLVTSNPSPATSRVSPRSSTTMARRARQHGGRDQGDTDDPEARASTIAQCQLRQAARAGVEWSLSCGRSTHHDGVYPISATYNMGQRLFGPNTVFSFYPRTYPLPGSSTL